MARQEMTVPITDPCAIQLRAAMRRLSERRVEIADGTTDAIAAEIVEVAADPELLAATRVSTLESVNAFLAAVEAGGDLGAVAPPAASLRLARDFVHAGLPFTALLRKYRVGQAAFSRYMLDELGAQIEDRALFEEAVRRAHDQLFAFVDHVADAIVEEYLIERQRWHDGSQSETIQDILAGRLTDPQLAARRLGHRLDRWQIAFAIWSDEDQDRERLRAVATELGRALGCRRPLLLPAPGDGIFGWLAFDTPPELSALSAPATAEVLSAASARVAFGEAGRCVDGFCRSHREALRAREMSALFGRPTGSITHHGAIALSSLVLNDLAAARDFVARELGGLAADDDATRRIAATIRVYLEEASSPVRTSRRLGVHANTVTYRVRRAEALRGRPVSERTLELQVALGLLKVCSAASSGH